MELMSALPMLCLFPLILYPPKRWNLSVDPDDVTFGQRSVPSSSGHERLVHLQRHPGRGQCCQPGVSGEVRLQEQQLPEESVRPAGAAGTVWKVMKVCLYHCILRLVYTRCGTAAQQPIGASGQLLLTPMQVHLLLKFKDQFYIVHLDSATNPLYSYVNIKQKEFTHIYCAILF